MSVNKIANRYAKSLIDLALEKNILEAVVEDMRGFLKLTKNKDFSLMLKSPVIHSEKKRKVFEEIFKGKVQVESLEFFEMVIQKNRENILPEIIDRVIAMYKEMKGITMVRLISASEMNEQALARIDEKLKKAGLVANVAEFELEVDPSLIGGFVIEIDDKLYDASVAGKMKKLSKELI